MRDEHKRQQNETKFGSWEELPDGGRRYSYDVPGQHGLTARYVKDVDVTERTVQFCQEIYDDKNRLVEIHEKYPVDKGHIKIAKEE